MSRISQFTGPGRWLLLLSALTAALWLLPCSTGQGATNTYGTRQRTVNAGVVFVGRAIDGVGSSNPAPYLFHVLNQRVDIKPLGWNIVNPLAPSSITTATQTRWGRDASNKFYYNIGDPVTPDMAAYWEVPLRDMSADQLQQFDILYLHAAYQVGATKYSAYFTPADNEKLRRFVDNGGQLFIEYGGPGPRSNPATGYPNDGSFFADTDWLTASDPDVTLGPIVPGSTMLPLHPLVSQPYLLGDANVPFFLGMQNDTGIFGRLDLRLPGQPGVTGEFSNLFGAALYRTPPATPAAPTFPGVSAAQLGAGQIIVSAVDVGRAVSLSFGAYFGTPNLLAAPTIDLQFLSNMISWADTHPSENKTSHQNSAQASSGSFAPAWSYVAQKSSQSAPGAAVWGNFVFVTDAGGTLHAFDAYPDEDLTGSGFADNGVPDFTVAPATAYDQLWSKPLGTLVSAPTVATFGGNTLVMVEDQNGVVYVYNAVTGTPFITPKLGTANSASFTVNNPVPAPTYYDGRVYAGQPDGTLLIYSLNGQGSAGTGAIIPVAPGGTSDTVTASPAVGLLASGGATNTVVALVPTTQSLNTVLLGARNDPLIAYSINGDLMGYNVNKGARYNLNNLFVDPASVPVARAYDDQGVTLPTTGLNGQDPVFASKTYSPVAGGIFFGDWDADFAKSASTANGTTLTLHSIKALSYGASSGTGATLSAPAMDRQGNYFYTVNASTVNGPVSYLFGVHDDLAQRNVRLKFRFRIPTISDGAAWNYIDADNVDYTPLQGFTFVGAPVVDAQGNVYAAAYRSAQTTPTATPAQATIFCFNANQEASAELINPPAGFDAAQASYTQPDESGGAPNTLQPGGTIGGVANAGGTRFGQFTAAGSRLAIFNFGHVAGGQARQIAGNLTEPQPITGQPNPAQAAIGPFTMQFHTNLVWYTTFRVNGTISPLTKTGNTLLLTDSGDATLTPPVPYNVLYKMPGNPTIGNGKVVTTLPARVPLGTGAGGAYLNIGAVTAAPSAGGGAMVINGTGGVAAFNQQLTLIADNNRILQVDNDGNAVWSADATTRVVGNGASTKVDFAHPTSLSPVSANDYMVADTGNNRCVRFDRAGSVLWELTRFIDPGVLMAPGQPVTLSQPTSIEIRTENYNYKDVNGKLQTGKRNHYLVADSGNNRIVEVTDTLGVNGNVLTLDNTNPATEVAFGSNNSTYADHILTWVTHTGDKYGRRYRYAGASYLYLSPTIQEVVAFVTNTRVAKIIPPVGPSPFFTLTPASGDTPGGSIVSFDRTLAITSFATIPINANDLNFVSTSFVAPDPSTLGKKLTFPVRNPRFLHVFVPPSPVPAGSAPYSFLYADDNGAFDLNYLPTGLESFGLAFTQGDILTKTGYRSMTNPVAGIPSANYIRTSIPFVPTCVQRLNIDATASARYLITQSFSQGELGTPAGAPPAQPKIGGEIFEVDVDPTSTVSTIRTGEPVGGFGGGATLSRPTSTSPLTQPTCAIRTAQ